MGRGRSESREREAGTDRGPAGPEGAGRGGRLSGKQKHTHTQAHVKAEISR